MMHGAWARADDRRPFIVATSALVTLAWLALWVWGRSPYGRYLDHRALEDPQGIALVVGAFVAGWTLMIIAMMLPTSLPLVLMFHTVAHRVRPVALLVAGYLSVWVGFGGHQYTALKVRCLDKCRSPFSFIVEHWRGRNPAGEAFRLGLDHGVFCLGCC